MMRDKARSVMNGEAIRPEECNRPSLEIVPSQIPSDSAQTSPFSCEDRDLELPLGPHFSLSTSLPVARNQTDLGRVLHVPPISERVEKALYNRDPLRIDLERLCKEMELHIQLHEAMKLRLKSDQENETAQIKRKYEAKLHEAEVAYLKRKQKIHTKRMIVGMNRALAMVSRLTGPDHHELHDSVRGSHYSITVPQSSFAFDSSLAGQFSGLQQPTPLLHSQNIHQLATLPSSYTFASPSASQFLGFQQPTAPPHSQIVQSQPLLSLFDSSPADQFSGFQQPTAPLQSQKPPPARTTAIFLHLRFTFS